MTLLVVDHKGPVGLIWTPSILVCFVPSLVEIGSVFSGKLILNFAGKEVENV